MTPRKRFTVLARDRFRCVYCGRDAKETKLHVDHVVARANGGSNELANLATACEECNLGKGAMGCYACGLATCQGMEKGTTCPEVTAFFAELETTGRPS